MNSILNLLWLFIYLFILTPFCKAIMAEISNLNNFSVHVTILVYLLLTN
jgi:hypothetical protein